MKFKLLKALNKASKDTFIFPINLAQELVFTKKKEKNKGKYLLIAIVQTYKKKAIVYGNCSPEHQKTYSKIVKKLYPEYEIIFHSEPSGITIKYWDNSELFKEEIPQ